MKSFILSILAVLFFLAASIQAVNLETEVDVSSVAEAVGELLKKKDKDGGIFETAAKVAKTGLAPAKKAMEIGKSTTSTIKKANSMTPNSLA